MKGRIAAVVAALLGLSGVRLADAAPSCAASCVYRMASCRAEQCSDATGADRRHCRDVCRAVTGCAAGGPRIRTIATGVNECHAAGGVWTARGRLEIRRGDCPPVTVMPVEANEPAADLGLCQIYGQIRIGGAAVSIGVLQGLAVSPDGDTILFQVTDDFVGRLAIGGVAIPTPGFMATEGIYVVHADGSGLRRIADQSREAPFAVVPASRFPFVAVSTKDSNGFAFSPDGRSVVLSDRGPGADGSDAPQVVTIDPRSGARQQLTKFTASQVGIAPNGLSLDAFFLDDDRIGGLVYERVAGSRIFRMRRDGEDFQYIDLEAPTALQGAMVVQSFRVSGPLSDVFVLRLHTTADRPFPGPVSEIFVRNGQNLLQLTQMGRSDTQFPFRLRDRDHVVFAASGDPVKRNASNTCQLFNIDVLAGHLRQLTRFDGGPAAPGCTSAASCTVAQSLDVQDPATGAIVFDSSCTAFGSSAVSQQVYAIRPDGSGFRQLTNYRGMTTDADGAVSVELPGPVAYQALLQ